jgi:hypothetical protein
MIQDDILDYNASIVQNKNFVGVELHAGQKSDVPIRPVLLSPDKQPEQPCADSSVVP